MKLLLDTHILLWWLAGDPRLPRAAEAIIGDTANAVHVSAASFLEVAIKSALGRIDVDLDEVVAAIGRRGSSSCRSPPVTASNAAACHFIIAIRSTGCWSRRAGSSRCVW
jgi:PIN domain nuclease of toxin-antitoxin system